MTSHESVRQQFDESLDEILRGMVELGALVLENIRRATESLLENRLEQAGEAIAADDEIDEAYVSLERTVFEVMARQQPVAGDLRFLISCTRVLYEIERSGDLAVNIAKGLVRRDGYTLDPALHGLIARLSRLSADQFGDGLEVLAALDGTAAERLDRADDAVDELVGEAYAAIAREAESMGFDLAMELTRVARYLERIADHAVNIAEHVMFTVTGAFPEDDAAGG